MNKCVRCGKCCLETDVCDLRGWVVKDKEGKHLNKFPKGKCDQLYFINNIAYCRVIESAFNNPKIWSEKTRKWLVTVFVGCGCEYKR